MLNDLPKIMLLCLSLTILVETFIAFLLKYRKTDIIYVVLVNILTNPLVISISTYILFRYGIHAKKISMIILELLAFITEGIIYWKVLNRRKINPFLLSLILNICSYSFGLLYDLIF